MWQEDKRKWIELTVLERKKEERKKEKEKIDKGI